MQIEKWENDLSRMHQVVFEHIASEEDIQNYRVEGDAQLFQEAATWLKEHPNYSLIDIGFHQPSMNAERREGARLILYVEPL